LQTEVVNSQQSRARSEMKIVSGLYFCGFVVSPTGMLREIGIEAKWIANDIVRHRS
jgi:indole-3-pyruvate monooxygenase